MRACIGILLLLSISLTQAVEPEAKASNQTSPSAREESGTTPRPRTADNFDAALARLKLPGVKINPEERCVDVDAKVCLREGLLELVACTKGTKEHESLVVVEAKPSHIHTALLLLRANPGNPAMQQPLDQAGTRFIPVPPRGGAVEVFLVIKTGNDKPTERPINDFIERNDQSDPSHVGEATEAEPGAGKFPTHTFLFAGSILIGNGSGPRQYLCDQSGNVISIATFGDELLCLPDIHENANGALVWAAKTDSLPAIGTEVILRLRPQGRPPLSPKATDEPAKDTGN